jgi:hypothetical protein
VNRFMILLLIRQAVPVAAAGDTRTVTPPARNSCVKNYGDFK